MLNDQQVRRYHEDGFVHPVRAFSAETAAVYRQAVERTCAKAAPQSPLVPGAPSYRVKPYLFFEWAAALVRD